MLFMSHGVGRVCAADHRPAESTVSQTVKVRIKGNFCWKSISLILV